MTALTEPAGALTRLGTMLTTYTRARRLAPERAVLRTGRNVAIKSYVAFARLAPDPGAITAAAQSRGYRLGRRGPGVVAGISARAWARAREVMGGEKSVLISPSGDGTRFRFVRRGLSGRRVQLRNGRTSYAVGADSKLRRSTDKVVNLRAVATHFDLVYRESGRRYLAVSWLYRRWRKLAQSDSRRAPGIWRRLENMNPRATLHLLGDVELTQSGSPANNVATTTLRISSYVPGIAAVGGRGIFSQILDAVTVDMGEYLVREEAAELRRRTAAAIQGTSAAGL